MLQYLCWMAYNTHLTTSVQQPTTAVAVAQTVQAQLDAEDADAMDAMPLQDDAPSDDDAFFECDTWSGNNEDYDDETDLNEQRGYLSE